MIRTPRAAAYARERAPLALEANLVGERLRAREALPARRPVGVPLAERRDLRRRRPRRRDRARSPLHAANAEARYTASRTVRWAERQDLPPALAGGREPVDEPLGLRAEASARQRGGVEQDPGRPAAQRLRAADRVGAGARVAGERRRADLGHDERAAAVLELVPDRRAARRRSSRSGSPSATRRTADNPCSLPFSSAIAAMVARALALACVVYAGSVTRISVPDPRPARPRASPWSCRTRSSIVSSVRRRRSGSASSATVATTPPSSVRWSETSMRVGGPRRTAWSIELADDRVERDPRRLAELGAPSRSTSNGEARAERRRPGRRARAAPARSRGRGARPARARTRGRAARRIVSRCCASAVLDDLARLVEPRRSRSSGARRRASARSRRAAAPARRAGTARAAGARPARPRSAGRARRARSRDAAVSRSSLRAARSPQPASACRPRAW